MRINFILPFKSLSGGIKVVLEYANRLSERGHQVTVVYPILPFRLHDRLLKAAYWRAHGFLANLVRGNRIDWFALRAELRGVPLIIDRFIPDADAVVATSWPTAYSVAALEKSKGQKFYFIQGYEIWQGLSAKVDQSYCLPLRQIVIASWLEDLMKVRFKGNVVALIINGVDLKTFYNLEKVFNFPRRILMMYSRYWWKGFTDGLKAFQIAHEAHPDIRLVLFGLEKGRDVPANAEFYRRPRQDDLRRLYSSSDIFLSPSRTEGCGLTPMEAMACKCAVVATNVGGIPDYAVNGETVLAVEAGNVGAMAQALVTLLDDPVKLRQISLEGFKHISQFTWEKATDKFEAVLKSCS